MIFIAVEGPDGAGKSTVAHGLARLLNAQLTHEPTKGRWGREAKRLVDAGRNEEALDYFLADRKEHALQVIYPTLMTGRPVVCDRFYLSSVVYQCCPGESLKLWRGRIGHFTALYPPALLPHLTVMVTADREVLEERCRKRDGKQDVALTDWVMERYRWLMEEREGLVVFDSTSYPERAMAAGALSQVIAALPSYVGEAISFSEAALQAAGEGQ